ncbi:MAG: metal-dependent transcriptional regulator, partial [Oscillospiraceae bacterium]|nr:metal-dependent transcriptional regulator [Oscillospiraceae bacterium]
LSKIGVDPERAAEDACKIEHDLCEDTFAAIKKHCGEIGAL